LPASYVGLLLDPSGKPAVLASSRRHGHQIAVKLLQPLAVPAGQVAQLWGLPKDGGAPFPLGVVPPNDKPGGTVSLPLADSAEKLFFNTTRLAVSLEAAPAKAGDKPSGDFVLSGACVKLW
jgi:anti-sigma-K factor RskA